MKYLDLYREFTIEPLEKLKVEIIKEYLKSSITKKEYREMLELVSDELLKRYQRIYERDLEEIKKS